ncbi:DUF6890 family protein [Marinomonas sp. PE14-40]|uniref:DUF6890 family protein n=1 Tax=Marinomonas sp. PE14-40 TaxID=3060621 RepID=UPI003F661E07
MERNSFEQLLTLRRRWLPHDDDEPENLGRALWLEGRDLERNTAAIANGIAKAFSGK